MYINLSTNTPQKYVLSRDRSANGGNMITKIYTENAPAAIGPYSQGIVFNGMVFTSGQIPLNPETGDIEGDTITEQTHRTLKNLQAVLEQANSSLLSVIKTTCFLSDMDNFAEFNKVYEQYLTQKPARSCVAVKSLPKNVLVEVEAVGAIETNKQ